MIHLQKSLLTLLLAATFTYITYAQNIELIGHVPAEEAVSDIWGYVDAQGIEYAVMGDYRFTKIYSLEDPSNPKLVANIPGTNSIWRDMKSYGNYIYTVTDEGADGLLIIDMSKGPDTITHTFYNPEIPISASEFPVLYQNHNIFIDEKGFAYLAGGNISRGGVLIFDLKTDTIIPKYVGIADLNYAHDVYVKDDLMFASEFSARQLAIYDVSDRANPKLLATQPTTLGRTHNAWASDDNKYVFTTDETGNAFLEAYDVSDLNDIKFLDKYQPLDTKNRGVIPHNTHYHNGFTYTSWYSDGVVIVDALKPDNLIKVGQYDTFIGGDGGFNGCWGAYPFLPSGLLLASDISGGLFVLRPSVQRACYLEGSISDDKNNNPITGAMIKILSDDINEAESDPNGDYKTGQASSGSYTVVVEKSGYQNDTTSVTLDHGQVTIHNVRLKSLNRISITAMLEKATAASPIADGMIVFENEDYRYTFHTNELGMIQDTVFEGSYEVYGGKWGYKHKYFGTYSTETDVSIVLSLEEGYQDDFIFDQGWTVSGTASAGHWELAKPQGTFYEGLLSNVNVDIDTDFGNQCYVTGNNSSSVSIDDVDNGITELKSPTMNLSTYDDPLMSYHVWFFNSGGSSAVNDSLSIFISNGEQTVLLETIKNTSEESGMWVKKENMAIKEFITLTDQMNLMIVASDYNPGHLVEAGFDGFVIENRISSGTGDTHLEPSAFTLSPNPFNKALTIRNNNQDNKNIYNLEIYNISGQRVLKQVWNSASNEIILGDDLNEGVYVLRLIENNGQVWTQKIIKQRF